MNLIIIQALLTIMLLINSLISLIKKHKNGINFFDITFVFWGTFINIVLLILLIKFKDKENDWLCVILMCLMNIYYFNSYQENNKEDEEDFIESLLGTIEIDENENKNEDK